MGAVQSPALNLFTGTATAKLHRYGAVFEGAGYRADGSNGDRRPGREPARFMVFARRADYLAGAAVPGIEDAPQLLGLGQEGVSLVDQERRARGLDGAEH